MRFLAWQILPSFGPKRPAAIALSYRRRCQIGFNEHAQASYLSATDPLLKQRTRQFAAAPYRGHFCGVYSAETSNAPSNGSMIPVMKVRQC
jgi:hypothetical protein